MYIITYIIRDDLYGRNKNFQKLKIFGTQENSFRRIFCAENCKNQSNFLAFKSNNLKFLEKFYHNRKFRGFFRKSTHTMTSIKYYPFFQNLANPLKIEIVGKLKEKPSSVLELAKKLNVEQSKLSHALKSLKNCSIVNVKKDGKKRIYCLNCETILPMLEILDKHENKFCLKCKAMKEKK